jgi:mono/diheme cytochrome c family protein
MKEAVMVKLLVVFAVFLSYAVPALAQQADSSPNATPPAEFKIPVEAARQANPVKPTPESLARSKKLYGYDCAMCHGKDGDGKGDIASDFNPPLSNFTDPAALKNMTDGEMFYIIKNGKAQMPAEGTRGKPDDIWSMVNYIRAFSKTKTAAAQKSSQ